MGRENKGGRGGERGYRAQGPKNASSVVFKATKANTRRRVPHRSMKEHTVLGLEDHEWPNKPSGTSPCEARGTESTDPPPCLHRLLKG